MLKRKFYFIFSLFMGLFAYSQTDSVKYSPESPLDDGVFLTYADFRNNKAITVEQIQSTINKEQLGFVSKVMEQDKLNYIQGDIKRTVNSKEVWGYVQNNTFYVNYKGKFYRVPVFGSISYLVAQVEVQNTGFYDPRFGGYTGSGTTLEEREFLMNFYDGKLVELKMELLNNLLSRDKVLYEEYDKLSSRKQREQLYRFIRKYNEANPVYFLKV